jgi:hypothetical protein
MAIGKGSMVGVGNPLPQTRCACVVKEKSYQAMAVFRAHFFLVRSDHADDYRAGSAGGACSRN